MSGFRRYCFVALSLAAAAGAGCSASGDNLPREPVAGSVTLDGQALASGTIQFTPENQATGVGGGATIQNGQFSIPRETGLVPGSYRVAIYSAGAAGERTKGQAPEGRQIAKAGPAHESIPAKYNAQSELKAEIKSGGSNSGLQFSLVSK
jgi:hypothetical protein